MTNRPAFLESFPCRDGIYEVSPPRSFEGGEEEYSESIGGGQIEAFLSQGNGAWRLGCHHAGHKVMRWLEVGAGSGSATLGLTTASPGTQKIITDTSPAFLKILRRKLLSAGISEEGCLFATLAGEDLCLLPENQLDAIFIASALHHVIDWRGFIKDAHRALAIGGVLVFQEPFREGYLLMAMSMEIALSSSWSSRLSMQDRLIITKCKNSIYELADSLAPKFGEDIHNFLADDIANSAKQVGYSSCSIHRNAHFANFANSSTFSDSSAMNFTDYLLSFLEIHHRVSQAGMAVLKRNLAPILESINRLYLNGDGPAVVGCVCMVK